MAKSAQLFQQVHVPYIFMEWQQMFKRRMSDTACPPYAMQQLTDMLTQRGYSAHEVRTGITMSPEESTIRWRVGDIYWRHQTQPLLFPPLWGAAILERLLLSDSRWSPRGTVGVLRFRAGSLDVKSTDLYSEVIAGPMVLWFENKIKQNESCIDLPQVAIIACADGFITAICINEET